MNPSYATHIPLLKACCDSFKSGLIVEFGCGDSSTPFLHETYEHMEIITIENRLEWFLRWAHLTSCWHQFLFCYYPQNALRVASGARVAFIDCDPGYTRRPLIEALRWLSVDIIVAHDTHPGCSSEYAWRDIWTSFKYHVHDERAIPRTTAMSDTVDVTRLLNP